MPHRDNDIADLAPLAGLQLYDLGSSQNPITDVSASAGLATLDTFRLARYAVVDPTPPGPTR